MERNFSCRQGELDIIAKQAGYLVFIEVKYRKNSLYGTAAEAVTPKKRNRMRLAAGYYLYKRGIPFTTPCRFDVVAIDGRTVTLLSDIEGY